MDMTSFLRLIVILSNTEILYRLWTASNYDFSFTNMGKYPWWWCTNSTCFMMWRHRHSVLSWARSKWQRIIFRLELPCLHKLCFPAVAASMLMCVCARKFRGLTISVCLSWAVFLRFMRLIGQYFMLLR